MLKTEWKLSLGFGAAIGEQRLWVIVYRACVGRTTRGPQAGLSRSPSGLGQTPAWRWQRGPGAMGGSSGLWGHGRPGWASSADGVVGPCGLSTPLTTSRRSVCGFEWSHFHSIWLTFLSGESQGKRLVKHTDNSRAPRPAAALVTLPPAVCSRQALSCCKVGGI